MIFPRPAIGVSALIFDEQDRILLIKRGHPPAQGQWSVPGGKLEPGESLVQACQREVLEETGLSIELGPLVAVVERVFDDYHYVILDYLATPALDSIQRPAPGGDVDAAAWVRQANLDEYDLTEGLQVIIVRTQQMRDSKHTFGLVDNAGFGSDYYPPPV